MPNFPWQYITPSRVNGHELLRARGVSSANYVTAKV